MARAINWLLTGNTSIKLKHLKIKFDFGRNDICFPVSFQVCLHCVGQVSSTDGSRRKTVARKKIMI